MSSGALSLLAFLATIVAANWAIAKFGLVPVGFGLIAPAGVYFAGLAFTLRAALTAFESAAFTLGAWTSDDGAAEYNVLHDRLLAARAALVALIEGGNESA